MKWTLWGTPAPLHLHPCASESWATADRNASRRYRFRFGGHGLSSV